MKILIVGNKGFIGSWVFRYFSSRYETFGCDVYPNYNETNYFVVDASSSYYTLFQALRFDVCINCAGTASVPESYSNASRDFELNVRLVFRLLDSIKASQSNCKFINLSSAAVYGNPLKLPVPESHVLGPISPYGHHKVMAEKLCEEFAEFFHLPTCSVRIFSAYGPGLRKQIFWDWFQKSFQHRGVDLLGTGEESRDYIYVEDIAHALDKVMQKAAFNGEAYNLASGNERKIREVAVEFFAALQSKNTYRFTQHQRIGDPIRWCADIGKMKALGFEPSTTFESGIREYITWAKGLP